MNPAYTAIEPDKYVWSDYITFMWSSYLHGSAQDFFLLKGGFFFSVKLERWLLRNGRPPCGSSPALIHSDPSLFLTNVRKISSKTFRTLCAATKRWTACSESSLRWGGQAQPQSWTKLLARQEFGTATNKQREVEPQWGMKAEPLSDSTSLLLWTVILELSQSCQASEVVRSVHSSWAGGLDIQGLSDALLACDGCQSCGEEHQTKDSMRGWP